MLITFPESKKNEKISELTVQELPILKSRSSKKPFLKINVSNVPESKSKKKKHLPTRFAPRAVQELSLKNKEKRECCKILVTPCHTCRVSFFISI